MTELKQLKSKLDGVNERIARINGGCDHHLDGVQKHFHLGTVGGSGRNINKLNARRSKNIEKTIDTAVKYTKLARERDELIYQIQYIESGRKTRNEKLNDVIQERVRSAAIGDVVIDSAYGEVKVIRVNKKTLTIECRSGYREARPFSLIVGVVKQAT